SPLSRAIARRCDFEAIRSRRRSNYRRLLDRLRGRVVLVRDSLEEGVSPLFFPLLVTDKAEAGRRLAPRGGDTGPVSNPGDPGAEAPAFADAAFLRQRVLELPIHQDVTPDQVDFMADEILGRGLALAA